MKPRATSLRLRSAPSLKAVERIWGMRKKAVGPLGNMQGGRRPIPFVEDTAVPPEHLADYIAEFRAALDRRGLVYGMFGHVDAGVLHVRPAIDMTDPEQEPLIRADHGRGRGADAKVRWRALGGARQGRALGIRASLLWPALSLPATDQGRLRPSQPAQPRQDRGTRRKRSVADR